MSFRQQVLHSAPIIAFTLVIVFLGLSLGGYDSADPPGWNASPRNEPPTNPCGPVGATLAHLLFITLGWSSWFLLLGLAVLDLLVCVRRPVPDRLGPSLGFGLVLVVTAGLIHKLAPNLEPSPPVGSGGYIGAFDVKRGTGWHQITAAEHFGRAAMRGRVGSRRERRRTPRDLWQKSKPKFR